MTKGKASIKIFSIVVLMPSIIFMFFMYTEKNYVHAWFWATVVGLGNLMLLFSAPDRKIINGFKKLDLLSWLTTIGIPVVVFFYTRGDSLTSRLIKSLCLIVGFVGSSVFGMRVMELLHLRKKG